MSGCSKILFYRWSVWWWSNILTCFLRKGKPLRKKRRQSTWVVAKKQKNPHAEMITRLRYTDSAYTDVLNTQWSQPLGTVINVSPKSCSTCAPLQGLTYLHFPLPGLPSPSPFPFVRKDPKCTTEWTSPLALLPDREGRGRALCQVCTPGCGGGVPLAPGPGHPEPSDRGERGPLLRAPCAPEAPLISHKELKALV